MKALYRWFKKRLRFIGTVAIGHGAKQVEEVLFDWILYGAVVGVATYLFDPVWGSFVGFLIMTPLSALVCWVYIKLYDWAKIDWFGFEALKEVRKELEGDGWWMRVVRKVVRMGDVPAFFILSINSDPFMTTIYLRKHPEKYAGFTARDWRIFWASVLFSNAYWTLRWTLIITIALWLVAFLPLPMQEALITWWNDLTGWIGGLF